MKQSICILGLSLQFDHDIPMADFSLFTCNQKPDYIISNQLSFNKTIHYRSETPANFFCITHDGHQTFGYKIQVSDPARYDEFAYVATLDILQMIMLKHHKYIFHASAIEVNGQAILFAGQSGIGKTTLSKKILNHLGGRWINDDKPILYVHNNQWMTAGSPWCGKDRLGSNNQYPIKEIVFLEQGKTNKKQKMSITECIIRMRSLMAWSASEKHIDHQLNFIECLVQSVSMYVFISANNEMTVESFLSDRIKHEDKL